MSDETQLEFLVTVEEAGSRLDVVLAARLPQYSRSQVRQAITHAASLVDGEAVKPSFRVRAGQQVVFATPELSPSGPQPENIPLEILYEDRWMAVINKPAGMVVHPSKGHWQGTLTAALAYHFENLSQIGGASRPGIVHPLDRDTSGVIVIAKNDQAHTALAAQFEARTVEKQYFSVVLGRPDRDSDVIDQPIGPHPYQREKMAIRGGHPQSRQAQTLYQVVERFNRFAAIHVWPKTGRTHQIRLHLAHIGHAVLCDRLYGGRAQITRGEIRGQRPDEVVVLQRQALHAQRLCLLHPTTGEKLEFTAELPQDLQTTLGVLRASAI